MRLKTLRLRNFQSFGGRAAVIAVEPLTFLIGPNGSGKTAVLQALSRLFGVNPRARAVQPGDFHVDTSNTVHSTLWIEAEFDFPELRKDDGSFHAVPDHIKHFTLEAADAVPILRVRLTAKLADDGEVDETTQYVLQADSKGEPTRQQPISRHDRSKIQVHYLPARRDPSDHISYNAAALLGKMLRASNWQTERDQVKILAQTVNDELLTKNAGVVGVTQRLATGWSQLHKGTHFKDPALSFEGSSIEVVLRNLSVSFTPGHGEESIDFARLSDGQQSLLYLSLVLCAQTVYKDVLSGKLACFDSAKLRPPTFTMVVMEEPENSLSPHYLGRIVKTLNEFCSAGDAQAIVATHAPSMLRRVSPTCIRYLRLNSARQSAVQVIVLPDDSDAAAHKFVKEAVKAYPELYFARLVILGEGDSEEIVIPRLLQAAEHGEDDSSIAVVPLGGRHVNHFWRLLKGLRIPFVTLLDLDSGRHQAGWGRIRYALKQAMLNDPSLKITQTLIESCPRWDDPSDFPAGSAKGKQIMNWLEDRCGVFFSTPLDLDYALLSTFRESYGTQREELTEPDAQILASVLGKSARNVNQYTTDQQKYFGAYHRIFKLESKPVAHIAALAVLNDAELLAAVPDFLDRLLKKVHTTLQEIPE